MSIFDLIRSALPPWAMPAVMIASGLVLAYWYIPGLWTKVQPLIPSLPSIPGNSGSPDVSGLLDDMVCCLPAIKDPDLHQQAVNACVAYSEAIIREAGLAKAEKK